MNCTKYDDPISYNAPILYNGVCVTPPVPTPGFRGGGYAYPSPRKKKKKEPNEEDEVIAIMLAEFMDDDD